MKKSFLLLLLIAFLILLINLHIAYAQKNVQAKLNIDLNADYQLYHRMIFGQFIEHFHRQI